jgi:hypothetical protein
MTDNTVMLAKRKDFKAAKKPSLLALKDLFGGRALMRHCH